MLVQPPRRLRAVLCTVRAAVVVGMRSGGEPSVHMHCVAREDGRGADEKVENIVSHHHLDGCRRPQRGLWEGGQPAIRPIVLPNADMM